ncbi:MAG TPA: toxin TcdB middle/N-terminal domain-containing protein, partial [Bacteroidales bacterium]|nr:toxin TcdB middle/N-terminal domain-containing protein [Bacteroidales bacterium]
FIGTIDINNDGTDAYVYFIEDYQELTYEELWNDYCPSCYVSDPLWNNFINEYSLEYPYYTISYCSREDTDACREAFLESGSMEVLMGYKIYIKHLDDSRPSIYLGYSNGTHTISDPLYTMATSVDINSDGNLDLILYDDDGIKKIYYNFEASYSNGDISYTYDSINGNYSGNLANAKYGDFNGDGNIELVSTETGGYQICFITSGKPGKLVSSIRNGVGIENEFEYKPLSDPSVYTKQSNAVLPVIDYAAPTYVVSKLTSDNGVANDATISYQYEGWKIHTQGKGSLGFAKTSRHSYLSNITVTSSQTYNTQYFYPVHRETLTKNGSTNLSYNEANTIISPESGKLFKVFADTSIQTDYLNNITSTTTYSYLDDLLQQKKTEVGNDFVSKTYLTYTNAGWHNKYLPESIIQSYIRGSDSIQVKKEFQYEESTGLLSGKTDFADSDMEVLSLFHSYNDFGSPQVVSITAERGASSVTDSIVSRISYSDDGRFVLSKRGELNTAVTYNYDTDAGLLLSESLPNGNTAEIEYGPFNRKERITDAEKRQSLSKLFWSDGNSDAPAGSMFMSWGKSSGTDEAYSFLDVSGRVLRSVNYSYSGEKVFVDYRYDSTGRIYKTSLPYFDNEYADTLWSYTYYDALGRVSSTQSADNTLTSLDYTTPLTTRTTVSKGTVSQTMETKVNALGEIIESKDNLGVSVVNSYYPDGKLYQTYTSNNSNEKITAVYDTQGHRVSLNDPDAGTTTSDYDSFGMLLWEKNAKGDSTSFTYDKLGRPVIANDSRGGINYVYNADTTSKSFGNVDSIYSTDGTLSEVYIYESSHGRLQSITKRIPNRSFTNTFSYDWYGRMLERTYPSGFEIQYAYSDNGILEQITGSGQTIWALDEINEFGQITSYSQGSYSSSIEYV